MTPGSDQLYSGVQTDGPMTYKVHWVQQLQFNCTSVWIVQSIRISNICSFNNRLGRFQGNHMFQLFERISLLSKLLMRPGWHCHCSFFTTARSARQKGRGQHAAIKVQRKRGLLMDQSEQIRWIEALLWLVDKTEARLAPGSLQLYSAVVVSMTVYPKVDKLSTQNEIIC